jgi:hypothetical protein
VLYLIKASRVQEYHQQNVAILGAPDDEVISITYSETWITPGVAMTAGMACVIVFADTPYSSFVPVRFGVLEQVTVVDTRTTVEVKLKAFVRPGGAEALNQLWQRFDAEDGNRPGRRFVVEDDNPELKQPQSHDEQEEAWRSVVDGLKTNGFFARSTFARVVRTMDDQGGEIDFRAPVRVGSTLGFEVEVRSVSDSDEEIRFYVDAEPSGSVIVDSSSTLPANGMAQVRFTPVLQGNIRARFRLFPEPLKSSQPTVELTVLPPAPAQVVHEVVHVAAPAGGQAQGVAREDVELLINRLKRDAELDPEVWLGLYEDVFLRWHPEDPEMLSAYSRLAYRLGRYRESLQALRKIDDRHPEDEAIFFFAALREGERFDLSVIERVDLDAESTFNELLVALDGVEASMLERVGKVLVEDVLGDANLERFAGAVFDRIPNLEFALHLVEQVGYRVDFEAAGLLLISRWPRPSAAPAEVIDLLLDWKVQRNKLVPYVERALSDAEDRRDWARIAEISGLAREMFSERLTWNRICLLAGSMLLDSGDLGAGVNGFNLVADVTTSSLGAGDLDTASRYAAVLIGYAEMRSDEGLRPRAEAQLAGVAAALENSRELKDWYSMQQDQTIKRLKQKLSGQVLHLVGDRQQPWKSDLEISLGLREVRWHESEKNRGVNHDWENALDPERDFVVVLWERVGHPMYTPLKDRCDRLGVTILESRTSKKDVIAGLDRVIFGEGSDSNAS